MRLWHKELISVLPREQLVAQWRELSAIASAIKTKGTPNHILVNFILDYDLSHFINYALLIKNEMNRRKYRTMDSVWEKIISVKPNWIRTTYDNIYAKKMDSDYLYICYYNLYEKYLCGGITEKEWNLIDDKYWELIEKYN